MIAVEALDVCVDLEQQLHGCALGSDGVSKTACPSNMRSPFVCHLVSEVYP